MKKLNALLGLFVLASIAIAAPPENWYPEDGTWRNPAASGRNYKIDVQDNILILNVFGYKANGNAVWYQAANSWTESYGNKIFSATLNEYGGGQCVGCPYTKPTVVGPNGGNIRITFTSPSKARVNWEGDSFNIERSDVVVGKSPKRMLGTWTVVYQIGSASFSEIFEIIGTIPSDTLGSSGIAYGFADYGDIVVWECIENTPSSAFNNQCIMGIADSTTEEIEDIFLLELPSINQALGVWISMSTSREYPLWMSRIAGSEDTVYSTSALASELQKQTSESSERQRDIARSEASISSSLTMKNEKHEEATDHIKQALSRLK